MPRLSILAAALLALNGALAGLWSHRWETWSEPQVRAYADRLERIPLSVDEWVGERIADDALTLPEEQVGRGVTVRYVSRQDGAAVVVFLTAGPTDGLVGHTPRACYPAQGYSCPRADLRLPLPRGEAPPDEFYVSDFTKPDAVTPVHLRVLWAWSADGARWQIPDNPRRTFRSVPALYKCYAVRQVVSPDEPVDGDPSARLLAVLLPQLGATLGANP